MTSTAKDVIASIVGSTACVYTGQPFDTVKVRMQVQPGEFKSTLQCFVRTFKSEGITTFWRGSVPALTGSLAENAVAFGVNGILTRYFDVNVDQNQKSFTQRYLYPFITGAITGSFAAIALCPCDVVKCRAQVSQAKGVNLTLPVIMSQIMKRDGVRGYFVGLGAQLLRDVPFYSTFFGTYVVCCDYLKSTTAFSESFIYFLSGGFSGQVAWLASIAPDTIKSTIQTAEHPLSIRQTGRDIMRLHGVRGLFTGVEVALVRAFPANAALFVGYEWSRKLMGP